MRILTCIFKILTMIFCVVSNQVICLQFLSNKLYSIIGIISIKFCNFKLETKIARQIVNLHFYSLIKYILRISQPSHLFAFIAISIMQFKCVLLIINICNFMLQYEIARQILTLFFKVQTILFCMVCNPVIC